MKNVIIATACTDQKLDVYYVHSLSESIRLCYENDIKLSPLFLYTEKNLSMAKNELLSIVVNQDIDSIVFIDNDIIWDSAGLLEVIKSTEDVVALPVVKKTIDNLLFDVDFDKDNLEVTDSGLIKVITASTSFLKINVSTLKELSQSADTVVASSGNVVSNVFDHDYEDGKYVNENTVISRKLKALGKDIVLNPNFTCGQNAHNVWAANFKEWLTGQNTAGSTADDVKSLYE